ncbi:unnamed protein product [Cylindrotheca closterium]|uniref:FAD-binding domain-containing protein n=1 Tax=Cylindrotheca closterium TaxID=2856 RepID=A0AAD2CSS9_9STRA|nr:unnamed protein product [Cylindrotheca closterium]
MEDQSEPCQCLIAGGGIVGLVLALALKKHVGITAEVYERAEGFADDVGAALGMYANGLRVLRDIDPKLMEAIKDAGRPYGYRRWERHDGTEIAVASEDVLSADDSELCSLGIRRWRLQKALYNAVKDAGIPLHFSKGISNVIERDDDDRIQVVFADGTSRYTELLFGADGGKSAVRETVAGGTYEIKYTGVTCLMGMSDCPSPQEGISFPTSEQTQCHAVYFPTGTDEQCFQIHIPTKEDEADKTNWGNLSAVEGQEEFARVAETMKKDGWHQRYIDPLHRVEHAVKVGFCLLNPKLERWVYGKNRRIILVGDAAHPPVPYVGQGAQMGVEDVGTLTLLLQNLCCSAPGNLDFKRLDEATKLYEKLRIPRVAMILDCSQQLGKLQESRTKTSDCGLSELLLQGEVMLNDTLPVMFPGATYNYRVEVADAITDLEELRAKLDDRNAFEDLMARAGDIFGEYEHPLAPSSTHSFRPATAVRTAH